MIDILNTTIIRDSTIHRFHVEGDKRGTLNGWYLAKPNGWIVYSSWRTGNEKCYVDEDGSTLSPIEIKIFTKEMAISKKIDLIEKQIAAEDLPPILDKCTKSTHPYLVRKGFSDMAVLVNDEKIVVPVYDISTGFHRLISMQYIYNDGSKKFAKNCRTKGGVHMIRPDHIGKIDDVFVCEGFATGLTVSIALQKPVLVCLYASNIVPVCQMLFRRFRDTKIIICADNDRNTKGNPGVTEACKAKAELNASIVIPDLEKCSNTATDFNDLMIESSIQEVRKQIENVVT